MPRKWNNYDGWTSETWQDQLNAIGNLIPLSKTLNIAAKNEFFDRKKIEYKKSIVQDALDLLHIAEWTPDELVQKQTDKLNRLFMFFKTDDIMQ